MILELLPPCRTTDVAARSTLVLAPHFDDEVLGCGGLLRKLADRGADVRVLFLTDGSGGIEEIGDRRAYSLRRQEEAKAATQILGCAAMELAGIRDGALMEGRTQAATAIRRALREQRPDLILVPSPLEITDDHRAAFFALHDVLSSAGKESALAGLGRELEIWLYEVNHPGYPDLLIDVSECRGTLERAMAAYASQEERHPYLSAALGLRQFRTLSLGPQVSLAEAYRRLVAADFSAGLAQLVAALGGGR
jgi:LmbE family N-acetylglucosaminyl deacetylase